MELQRGVCSLCSETTRVLTSSDAEDYCKYLPEILYENFLTDSDFQKIKKMLKVCSVCCYKIQLAAETKNLFHSNKENEEVQFRDDQCRFCKTEKSLVKIESNWKYFIDRSEGYVNATYDFPVCACPRCIFYFDLIYNFKNKLVYKFPQLAQQSKKKSDTPNKQNDTPKRKSESNSPPSSKKRKIFDNCFSYLQPLCNNNYHVDPELKRDTRLYKKIAYVNLRNSKDLTLKETPKLRPIIKIKLKTKKDAQPSVKLTKSEEQPNKKGHSKHKARRHSYIEKRDSLEEREENMDETPKAATTTLVPKRRVSVFMDNGEKQEEIEDKSNEVEEISTIVDKYIQSSEPDSKLEEDKQIDENGIETLKADVRRDEEDEHEDNNLFTSKEIANGENSEVSKESSLDEEKEKATNDDSDSSAELSELTERKTPPPAKSFSSSEGSDSDSGDKEKIKGNDNESDSLNGSERKKKRVTFSDEFI